MCSNFIFYELMTNKLSNSSAIILSIITLTTVFVLTNLPEAESAENRIMTFNPAPRSTPSSYTENGITVTTLAPGSTNFAKHIHLVQSGFRGPLILQIHGGCCSTNPYTGGY